ncbi:MAG: hypothetical protein QNJ74_14155, partial [Trichodesmium sp. MO_231.B1]|nr:hypothetical protein [Trichodesmium sp. MO_231.B1]
TLKFLQNIHGLPYYYSDKFPICIKDKNLPKYHSLLLKKFLPSLAKSDPVRFRNCGKILRLYLLPLVGTFLSLSKAKIFTFVVN